jgi:hypothetical protein
MKVGFAVTLFFISNWIYAQKYDYRWILGNYNENIDVVFTSNSADTFRTTRGVEMDDSQVTISDSSGNLLFYSNGARIYTNANDTMQNGDSINYGLFWQLESGRAYEALEDLAGLPTDSSAIWNLLHYYIQQNDTSEYVWRIDQTRIDMSKNAGQGEVLFKNKRQIQDTLGSYITACRHANGRDWWTLCSKSSSNCLYELLVQPDTILNLGTQCLGSNYISQDAGQAAFSPDGSKFAWVGNYGGVNLYDFDRCSGLLGNPVHLPLSDNFSGGILQYGLSFSPNSRFLYIAQSDNIFQFDTDTSNVWASLDTVGFYQTPPDSTTLPGYFFLMQLAPDGKIYLSSSNAIAYFHVINQPDIKGLSCDFVPYGFRLPWYGNTFGIPCYPNYRLGPLIGSPCDTIYKTDTTATVSTHQGMDETIIKIFPNPATNYTIVDYGFTDWSKGPVSLEIRNDLGQTVYSQQLSMYSGFQKIEVSKLTSGTYTALIKRSTGVVASGKFVKQ